MSNAAAKKTPTNKKQRFHHGDLRNAIIQTALVFLEERRTPQFTLREITGKIGVSHPSIYRHFEDKSSLLEALAICAFQRLHEIQQEKLSIAGSSVKERLRALCFAYLDFATRHPGMFVLIAEPSLFETQNSLALRRAESKALTTFVDEIIAGQKSGEVIIMDQRRIATVLWTSAHGFAQLRINGGIENAMGLAADDPDLPELLADTIITPFLVK